MWKHQAVKQQNLLVINNNLIEQIIIFINYNQTTISFLIKYLYIKTTSKNKGGVSTKTRPQTPDYIKPADLTGIVKQKITPSNNRDYQNKTSFILFTIILTSNRNKRETAISSNSWTSSQNIGNRLLFSLDACCCPQGILYFASPNVKTKRKRKMNKTNRFPFSTRNKLFHHHLLNLITALTYTSNQNTLLLITCHKNPPTLFLLCLSNKINWEYFFLSSHHNHRKFPVINQKNIRQK